MISALCPALEILSLTTLAPESLPTSMPKPTLHYLPNFNLNLIKPGKNAESATLYPGPLMDQFHKFI